MATGGKVFDVGLYRLSRMCARLNRLCASTAFYNPLNHIVSWQHPGGQWLYLDDTGLWTHRRGVRFTFTGGER